MKEYLLNKYKEHYTNMLKYMAMFGREYEKKVEYEYGAISVIGDILVDAKLLTQNEVVHFRNSL